MPEKKTIERAKKDKRQGKAPSTQAGEFVREEIHHVREGKHGARNTKQAVAIGLSKARRSGVELPPPEEGTTSSRTRKQAKRDVSKGKRKTAGRKASAKRSPPAGDRAARRATKEALRRQPRKAATKSELSRQARSSATRRARRGSTAERAERRGTTQRRGTSRRASS
jgi:hypothetical protein